MALHLHVHGGYPSYVGSGAGWRQVDWDAHKLVQALKGNEINGYATLKRLDGQSVIIRQGQTAPAFQIFGQWGAAKLSEVCPGGGLLVPVPSSSCVEFGTDAKGQALAKAICSRAPHFQLAEILRWAEPLVKASEGGLRHADALLEHVRIKPIDRATIVLVDDVATTGGHLKACARALRREGHTVEHALCAAQTVLEHPANMWAIPSRDLEAETLFGLL